MSAPDAAAPSFGASRDEVRRFVRGALAHSSAFTQRPPEERRKIADGLVKVLGYLVDPAAGQPALGAVAESLADDKAAGKLRDRMAGRQKLVGEEFKAGAAREGAKVFKELVGAVDFKSFVSGLIENVYGAIVKSSIQQMEAYAKLLENVVKSVEEFAKDNFTLEQARGFLSERFPRQLTAESGRISVREDGEAGAREEVKKFLEMKEDPSFDDEEAEAKVLQAAQLKMARMRQQQLATMVAMGINRIVVTEGEIKASVMFDIRARDTANRSSRAGMEDRAETTATTHDSSSSFWGSDSSDKTTVEAKVSSAYSHTQDQSASELNAKAQLAGNVLVRFKSETFPLERIASPTEMATVQERSKR